MKSFHNTPHTYGSCVPRAVQCVQTNSVENDDLLKRKIVLNSFFLLLCKNITYVMLDKRAKRIEKVKRWGRVRRVLGSRERKVRVKHNTHVIKFSLQWPESYLPLLAIIKINWGWKKKEKEWKWERRKKFDTQKMEPVGHIPLQRDTVERNHMEAGGWVKGWRTKKGRSRTI